MPAQRRSQGAARLRLPTPRKKGWQRNKQSLLLAAVRLATVLLLRLLECVVRQMLSIPFLPRLPHSPHAKLRAADASPRPRFANPPAPRRIAIEREIYRHQWLENEADGYERVQRRYDREDNTWADEIASPSDYYTGSGRRTNEVPFPASRTQTNAMCNNSREAG